MLLPTGQLERGFGTDFEDDSRGVAPAVEGRAVKVSRSGGFRVEVGHTAQRLLPYSYTGVWRELVRAAELAKIGHLGPHAFRQTYRSWLDAVGTPVAVQQKMMRHADVRTTFNI